MEQQLRELVLKLTKANSQERALRNHKDKILDGMLQSSRSEYLVDWLQSFGLSVSELGSHLISQVFSQPVNQARLFSHQRTSRCLWLAFRQKFECQVQTSSALFNLAGGSQLVAVTALCVCAHCKRRRWIQ